MFLSSAGRCVRALAYDALKNPIVLSFLLFVLVDEGMGPPLLLWQCMRGLLCASVSAGPTREAASPSFVCLSVVLDIFVFLFVCDCLGVCVYVCFASSCRSCPPVKGSAFLCVYCLLRGEKTECYGCKGTCLLSCIALLLVAAAAAYFLMPPRVVDSAWAYIEPVIGKITNTVKSRAKDSTTVEL